jgi:3-polyprenyl-4-hydroxybenzoate decarboxylase
MAGGRAGITLLETLDGSRLLSVRIIRSFDQSEDFVQGAEEHPMEALTSLARALYSTEIVVHRRRTDREACDVSVSVAGGVAVVPVSTQEMAQVLDRLARGGPVRASLRVQRRENA